MQSHNWITLALLGLLASSCFQAVVPTSTSVTRGARSAKATTQLSETKSVSTVNLAATTDTVIAVASGNTLSGTSITITPGSLNISTDIIVEQAADLGDTTVVSEVALAGGVSVSQAGAGVVIRPSSQAELTKPLQLNLPMPISFGLRAEGSAYAVYYKYLDPNQNQLITGMKIVDGKEVRIVFDEASGRDVIKFEGYFGAYWIVKLSRPIVAAEVPLAKISETPIANKSNTPVFTSKGVVLESAILIAQAKPEVVWSKTKLVFDATTRSLTLNVEKPLSSAVKACKADFFKSASDVSGVSVETGTVLTALLGSDKVPVGAVLGRFRCQDESDRVTISAWSDGVTVPAVEIAAPTTSAVNTSPTPAATPAPAPTPAAPTVSSATILSVSTSKTNGMYTAGEVIPLVVTFSEAVTVTGSPLFNMETGANDTAAFYVSGSGTNALTFHYTVVSGDTTQDLEYKAGAILLNAGSLNDSLALPAILTLPTPSLAAVKAIVIDAVAPSAPSSVGFAGLFSNSAVFAMQWAVGSDTNFSTHNVKVCSSSSCSVGCIGNSTSVSSPKSFTGTNGSTYYGCVQSVDTLGQVSAWVSSLSPITVDTTVPTVTRVFSSTANGSFGPGTTINLAVEFSEAVVSTGSPTLVLETGTTDRTATYIGGSGTNMLSFVYSVQAGDSTSDLNYLATNSLSGTIMDTAGNAATLTLPALGSGQSLAGQSAIVIDATPAVVSSVTSVKPDGAYGAGNVIDIVVNFSRPVIVLGATPQLALNTIPPSSASYLSGSGSSALTFRYTVQSGEVSSDLDYANTSAFISNSATIRNGIIDAVLSFPAPGAAGSLSASKALVIDGASPAPNLVGPGGFVTAIDGVAIPAINIDSSSGGDTTPDGRPITYTCVYDNSIDNNMSGSNACSTLPGAAFNPATGVFNWTPPTPSSRTTYDPYELKITGTNSANMIGSVYVAIKVLDVFNDFVGFDVGTMGQYNFDATRIDFSGGMVRLKPFDQADEDTEPNWAGFPNGADHAGSTLKQLNTGGCNGNTMNCFASLAGDWVPAIGTLSFKAGGEFALSTEFSHDNFANAPAVPTLSASAAKIGAMGINFSATSYVTKSNAFTPNFTINFWMKSTQVQGENSCNSLGEGSGLITALVAGTGQNDWGITLCNGLIKAGTGNPDFPMSSARAVNDGVWHMVTFTRNSSGTIRLFIDGVQNTATSGNTSALTAASLIHFGKSPATTYGYVGQMDEIGIWTDVLAEDSIAQLYERQSVANAGVYLSRVMDAEAAVNWDLLKVKTLSPFGKELPDSAASEVTGDYPAVAPGLMSGIRALYHFNDGASATTTPDMSGQGAVGTIYGTPTTGTLGKFRKSITFTSQNVVDIGNAAPLQFGSTSFTVSAWIRVNVVSSRQRIVSNGFTSSNAGYNLGLSNEFVTFGLCEAGGSASTCAQAISNIPVADGRWHHVAGVYDTTSQAIRIYIDGKVSPIAKDSTKGNCGTANPTELLYAGCTTNGTGSLGTTFIGGYKISSTYPEGFQGQIDEVAIWGRVLAASAIENVHRRGSERVLAQVRTCSDVNCSTTPGWKGPDLSPRTFFSEIQNNSTPATLSGSVLGGGLQLPLNLWAFTESNRYFQYRLILEGDDRAASCGGVNCGPEVVSTSVGPDHFPSVGTTVTRTVASSFYSLDSMTASLGNCPMNARFQFSINGSTWLWFNGSSWSNSDGSFNQANPASFPGLPQFGNQVGRGNLYVRSLLRSDGTSPCELDSYSLVGNTTL
ncbi:MAG: LamG domain-containing protein [Proteobacteria bacterium]|nr:MAG: LamG domain-containing protein [Pseudomonadota bacterium]